jgi:exosortase
MERKSTSILTRRDLGWAAALAVGAVAVTFDAWRDAWRIGQTDEECSYVLLAPIVIGWLVWVRRGRLHNCPIRGGWLGLLIGLAGWLIFWRGYVTDPVIWRAGAVVMAVGAVIAALGVDVLRRAAPAIVACAFLIPVDPTGRYRLAGPLQIVTARGTQQVCDLLGIAVERSGNLLSVNGVDVTVAEACNGMRMIMTLFMVCYVVAFTLPLRPWLRALVLLASPLVAIVSNVVRLVPTVWMFGHSSIRRAEAFHDISGWVMTVVSFLVLMGLAQGMRWLTTSNAAAPAGEPARTSARPGQAPAADSAPASL